MTPEFTYRPYREDDIPGLVRLWREETEWGELTEEMWREWYIDLPRGRCEVIVAEDSQTRQIAGQLVFQPYPVSVNGQEVRAWRPAAPILSGGIRGFRTPNPLDHPIAATYLRGIEMLQSIGETLLFMVPDAGWLRLFRMFPEFQCGSFPLWSLPLPLARPLPLGEPFTAAPLLEWDERVDHLWRTASRFYGCSIIRDRRTLSWKVNGGGYEVLAIERAGKLAGLVASREKGDRQWLICDVLAADSGESLRATLAAAANLAHSRALEAGRQNPLHKVSALVTPLMEPAARDLGFARDTYDFPLVVQVLNGSLARNDVAPERWYVSAND